MDTTFSHQFTSLESGFQFVNNPKFLVKDTSQDTDSLNTNDTITEDTSHSLKYMEENLAKIYGYEDSNVNEFHPIFRSKFRQQRKADNNHSMPLDFYFETKTTSAIISTTKSISKSNKIHNTREHKKHQKKPRKKRRKKRKQPHTQQNTQHKQKHQQKHHQQRQQKHHQQRQQKHQSLSLSAFQKNSKSPRIKNISKDDIDVNVVYSPSNTSVLFRARSVNCNELDFNFGFGVNDMIDESTCVSPYISNFTFNKYKKDVIYPTNISLDNSYCNDHYHSNKSGRSHSEEECLDIEEPDMIPKRVNQPLYHHVSTTNYVKNENHCFITNRNNTNTNINININFNGNVSPGKTNGERSNDSMALLVGKSSNGSSSSTSSGILSSTDEDINDDEHYDSTDEDFIRKPYKNAYQSAKYRHKCMFDAPANDSSDSEDNVRKRNKNGKRGRVRYRKKKTQFQDSKIDNRSSHQTSYSNTDFVFIDKIDIDDTVVAMERPQSARSPSRVKKEFLKLQCGINIEQPQKKKMDDENKSSSSDSRNGSGSNGSGSSGSGDEDTNIGTYDVNRVRDHFFDEKMQIRHHISPSLSSKPKIKKSTHFEFKNISPLEIVDDLSITPIDNKYSMSVSPQIMNNAQNYLPSNQYGSSSFPSSVTDDDRSLKRRQMVLLQKRKKKKKSFILGDKKALEEMALHPIQKAHLKSKVIANKNLTKVIVSVTVPEIIPAAVPVKHKYKTQTKRQRKMRTFTRKHLQEYVPSSETTKIRSKNIQAVVDDSTLVINTFEFGGKSISADVKSSEIVRKRKSHLIQKSKTPVFRKVAPHKIRKKIFKTSMRSATSSDSILFRNKIHKRSKSITKEHDITQYSTDMIRSYTVDDIKNMYETDTSDASSPDSVISTSSFQLNSSYAISFNNYQKQYKRYQPNIKKDESNQMSIHNQLQLLQKKAQMKKNKMALYNLTKNSSLDDFEIYGCGSPPGKMTLVQITNCFGKSLMSLEYCKFEKYNSGIPCVLIELLNRLQACNGLSQRRIFHADIKNNTCAHHILSQLMRDFFLKLTPGLLSNVSILVLEQIEKHISIVNIIYYIEEPNKSILLWLWDVLAKAAQALETNKMSLKSFSVSFAPLMKHTKCTSRMRRILINFFYAGIDWRLRMMKSVKSEIETDNDYYQ